MLAPGSQSWSITLAAGSDLNAADSHVLQPGSSLAGSGNLVLNDPHYMAPDLTTPLPSVIRTGTGSSHSWPAGTSTRNRPTASTPLARPIPQTGTAANDPYNPARGQSSDGTVLGADNSAYEASLNPQFMYYPQGGGNLLLSAQGNISGFTIPDLAALVGGWLWREGGSDLGQATAWGINFGSYTVQPAIRTL